MKFMSYLCLFLFFYAWVLSILSCSSNVLNNGPTYVGMTMRKSALIMQGVLNFRTSSTTWHTRILLRRWCLSWRSFSGNCNLLSLRLLNLEVTLQTYALTEAHVDLFLELKRLLRYLGFLICFDGVDWSWNLLLVWLLFIIFLTWVEVYIFSTRYKCRLTAPVDAWIEAWHLHM